MRERLEAAEKILKLMFTITPDMRFKGGAEIDFNYPVGFWYGDDWSEWGMSEDVRVAVLDWFHLQEDE